MMLAPFYCIVFSVYCIILRNDSVIWSLMYAYHTLCLPDRSRWQLLSPLSHRCWPYVLSDSPCTELLIQTIPGKGQTGDRLQLSLDCNTFFPSTIICLSLLACSCILHYHQHSYNQINNVALKACSPLKDLNPLLYILADSTNFITAPCQNIFAIPAVMLSFPRAVIHLGFTYGAPFCLRQTAVLIRLHSSL